MQTPLLQSRRSHLHRILAIACFAASVVLVAGCGSGGKDAKNQVTGKVTLDTKPVAGVVGFVYPDNSEKTSPIGTDGTYQIIDAPPGQVKIYVKGGLGAGAPTVKGEMKGGPEMAKDLGGGAAGVAPPTKYGSASTSGLTFEVKGGKQTFDIPLTP